MRLLSSTISMTELASSTLFIMATAVLLTKASQLKLNIFRQSSSSISSSNLAVSLTPIPEK